MADLDSFRKIAGDIVARTAGGDASVEAPAYNNLIAQFLAAGGSPNDVIVKIGEAVFGTIVPNGINDKASQGPHEDEPIEGSVRLPFDYLEQFMFDCFTAVGVPEAESRFAPLFH